MPFNVHVYPSGQSNGKDKPISTQIFPDVHSVHDEESGFELYVPIGHSINNPLIQ